MINVCHISTMTRWGGVERMLMDMLTTVKQQHVTHFLLTTSSSSEVLKPIIDADIDVFEPLRRFHYDPSAIFQMARWMRRKKINIVHTYNLFSNCWGGIAATLAGIPLRVAGEHGSIWLPDSMLTRLEKLLYVSADLIVANSFASKTMLSMQRKIPVEKIQVVHNAVQAPELASEPELEALRREFSLTDKERVVGAVGRLSESKDFFSWLDTAKLISEKHKDVRFLIVGDGPLAHALNQHADSSGIRSQVVFTGWRQDARNIMQLFDIYMSSSTHESFGNTLVEAALCKIPVIAPGIDGIPEVVVDGKTGLLVTPDVDMPARLPHKNSKWITKVVIDGKVSSIKAVSPHKMAQKVGFLLDNPALCRNLGEAAYCQAIEKFQLNRYIQDVEDIYISLYRGLKGGNVGLS